MNKTEVAAVTPRPAGWQHDPIAEHRQAAATQPYAAPLDQTAAA